jgi:beta-glucuronidase
VFEAVFHTAKVWLNGQPVGEHEGGYTPFEIDLTPLLKAGATNMLAVRADNSLPVVSGDWVGGGIIRDVYLLTTSRVFPVSQKVVATPDRISVRVPVRNTLDNTSNVQASFEVLSGGRVIAKSSTPSTIPPNLTQLVEGTLTIPPAEVKLWDLDHPNLYELRTVIAKEGEAIEGSYETEISSTFGIRTIQIQGTQILLNGEPVRLGGANRVSDHPRFGPIEPIEVLDEDLRLMKEAGMVFQRISRYPAPIALLEWADRNGMLLIEEAENRPFTAKEMGSEETRAKFKRAMLEMMERDANHPSVIAWSIGTEYESDSPGGIQWTREMYGYAKKLDPTRPVTFASSRNWRPGIGDEGSAYVDFISTNSYASPEGMAKALETIHSRWPGKPIFVAEFGLRSGDVKHEQKSQKYFQGVANVLRQHSYVAGAAVWTFNDYRGLRGAKSDSRWGTVDADRRTREAYTTLREEFSSAVVRSITQKNGNTFVEVYNRPDFPSQTLRDYEVRVGPNVRKMSTVKPGDAVTLEFEQVNPYKVEVRQQTGFIVAGR